MNTIQQSALQIAGQLVEAAVRDGTWDNTTAVVIIPKPRRWPRKTAFLFRNCSTA